MALLLSIVGTAAHHHDAHEVAASECAACLAHQAPAVVAPVGAMGAPVVHVRVLGTAPTRAVVVRHGRQAQGRAPPLPRPDLV